MSTTRRAASTVVSFAVAVFVSFAMLGVAPAHAYDAKYDGNDPIASGCSNGAVTVDSRHLAFNGQTISAYVELRYSPSCRTTWGRLTGGQPATADHAASFVRIHRNSDGKTFTRTWKSSDSGSIYTPMVNDANVTSHAHAEDDTGFAIFKATTIDY